MLIWGYWPVPAGGAEGQCRKLSKSFAGCNVRCTVLTARLGRNSATREKDGSVDIVRINIAQIWVDLGIAWRNRFFSRQRAMTKSPAPPQQSLKTIETRISLLNRMVRWSNTLTFIIGATIWLWMNKKKIDVIHVHIGDWIAGYAGWVGALLGIPVVCKASNIPVFPDLDSTIPFRNVWDAWRRKIKYVAMHEAIRSELTEEGVRPEEICLIPNGVEIPAGRAEPARGKYALFVGNFSQGAAKKGFDILLNAWAEVCRNLRNAKLVMAGQGDYSQWLKMAEQLGCSQNVEFAGYVDNMDDLYRKAALFILPSRHEGMSNALLEAQSWGLPAVVSAIPGNEFVIEDGITGIIVPVDDHLGLARVILEFLKDGQIREEKGANARARVEACFSMDIVTDKYRALYEDLSAGK
jgi:glycosyltransferase involved in cell wall biosynthesis